jgi:purine-binding chemotaxis protein CheW
MTALIEAPAGEKRTESAPDRQFLTFLLGEELFALSIDKVREIIEFSELTQVPLVPDFLCGIMNLRGAVIPVVDLLARFGSGTTSIGRRACVVIVEIPQEEGMFLLGIIVNAVCEVVPIPSSRIESRPSFGTRIRPEFVDSLLDIGGRFVVALDVHRTLSIEEMSDLSAQWIDRPELHAQAVETASGLANLANRYRNAITQESR